jgi:putative tryptophan/tyrosine transport system substrate-binding protein
MERRGSRLSRRQFMLGAAGLGLVAGCGRLPWQGQPQPPASRPRIGCLFGADTVFVAPRIEAFRQALRDLGYTEGQNIDIDYRLADGDIGRLPSLAAEMASLPVDVFLTAGPVPTQAAKDATTTIPIVMIGIPDPISDGFVASLARPGGNITGFSSLETGLSGKRLELLKVTSPTATRVAVLWTAANPGMEQKWRETQVVADALGVQLISVNVQALADIDDLINIVARENANGLMVWSFALANTHAPRVVDLALQTRLPAVYDLRAFVDAGGLMYYGWDSLQNYGRAAYYVDRILKGAKPADLPVEQPMTFDFVVNLKTARDLGITFPNEILLQVTEVIQ